MIVPPEPIELFGVRVYPITRTDLIDLLCRWAEGGNRKRVYNVNAHAFNLAWDRPEFKQSLNDADLVFCDGFGVKWAGWLSGVEIPERMTPPDWIDEFLARLPACHSVYLLGDTAKVVESARELMHSRHPHLDIGAHHGFFDVTGDMNESVVDEITVRGTSVLLVGMGMPRQEKWIDENIDDLEVSLVLPVGALFRYYAQLERRAPPWMSDRGLEWMYRLFQDPRRLLKRYVVGNTRLLLKGIRAALRSGSA